MSQQVVLKSIGKALSQIHHAVESVKDSTVEKTLSDQRYLICEGCDRMNSLTGTCKECGCVTLLKVTKEHETCPLNKW